jgi:hypothetical protein
LKRTLLSSVLVALVAAAGGAVAEDWSGAYGGVQFGALDGDVSGATDADGSGAIAGLHAGYDVDFGTFVLGAEIDLDFGSIDLGDAAEVDGIARLKLRAGADLGRTIVYGTAGVARAETSLGSGEGGFAGVGAGRRVGERAVVGGELLYQEFDDLDGSGETLGATTATARVTFSF